MVAGLCVLGWTVVVWQWQDPFTYLLMQREQRALAQRYEVGLATYRAHPRRASSGRPTVAEEARAYRRASERGDPIARLRIPKLDLDLVVVEGTDSDTLKKGPGRHLSTFMPGEGELSYIAGHRTTYGAPFSGIDKLSRGDRVTIELPYATFVYAVTGRRIVPASYLRALESRGREELALQACWPRFFASQRIIVYARPVKVTRQLDSRVLHISALASRPVGTALLRAALLVCLGLALYGLVAGGVAAAQRRRRLAASAENAVIFSLLPAAVAITVLLAAFVRRDFSFVYVAQHSSTTLPQPYAISALWGGQEGSLLLWLFLLTGYAAGAILLARRVRGGLAPWLAPVFALVIAFFTLLLTTVATPFAAQPAAAEGAGLNPSLQNPYMMTHPIFLYLGFVGLTVPWAFAMAALLSARRDELWIVSTRRWTLLTWTFLGIGQLLGAKWAYEEIGWGGYYAWDPVENAALMPWLAATAFLHSVMIQEKKGMLRVWNILLVILTFALSLFGTFLTRSGVLNSIHSFAQGKVGPALLGFIILVVTVSLVLFFRRLPLLRSETKLESPVSCEATFLYNNLLLVALTLTVLWGVIWPLVSEAVQGESRVVGAAYYNFFLRVFGLPLLLLLGIGPLIAWRKASLRSLGRTFLVPFTAALTAGAALLALGAGSYPPGLIAYTFAAFVLAAIVLEFARGTSARRALTGARWPAALFGLVAANRRRYGGYLVHVGVVMLAIGVAASSGYQTVRDAKLQPGDSMVVRGYTLSFQETRVREAPNALEQRAVVSVRDADRDLGVLEPGRNAYSVEAFFSTEVDIRTNWLTGEDLFLVVEQFNKDGSIYLRAFVKPLVNMIWLAGILFIFGSVVAMWPNAREQRRLVARYVPAVATD